ncbi:hypothetical protein [Bifidobacterium sp. M0353]|uniref:hypothetical protein n=1 Tax=Bifidobacterium sp. M0353 TaxID=2751006 RepID=UPI0018DCE596|nr:hypothetical protein [Bifidobacterium sp. M0353]MBI0149692.1 hypothetical protein [Bifidobacterium sp. M0353]
MAYPGAHPILVLVKQEEPAAGDPGHIGQRVQHRLPQDPTQGELTGAGPRMRDAPDHTRHHRRQDERINPIPSAIRHPADTNTPAARLRHHHNPPFVLHLR